MLSQPSLFRLYRKSPGMSKVQSLKNALAPFSVVKLTASAMYRLRCAIGNALQNGRPHNRLESLIDDQPQLALSSRPAGNRTPPSTIRTGTASAVAVLRRSSFRQGAPMKPPRSPKQNFISPALASAVPGVTAGSAGVGIGTTAVMSAVNPAGCAML